MIKFIKELKSVILNNAPLEEAFIVATDTKELFVDINNTRLQINDIEIVDTVADLDNILAPLANKFYFCQENNILYRHVDGEWVGLTTTQEQYESLVQSINDLTVAYEKISQGINTEYILEVANWNGNVYTIHNEVLFTQDTTVKLSASGNMTDAQYEQLSSAKIIPDDSDIANNNLTLKATGVVPTIDIPIIVSVFIDSNLYSIEDSLTSTSTVNPLSANQGRVLNEKVGDLSTLSTTDKTDAVSAINEIYTNVDAGKNTLATAITNKGIATDATDTFDTMATNISNILAADTTVQTLVAQVTTTANEVLSGEMFINDLGQAEAGTMPNNGNINVTLNAGESTTIPEGYHNGSGTVSVNSLASMTPGTATADDIVAGKTAYINGTEVTGTMGSNTIYMGSTVPTDDAGEVGDIFLLI